jgi:hypothetical protein
MMAIHEEESNVTWSSLMSPAYRGPLLAGVGLAVISAFDGINAFMYYRCGHAGTAVARVRRPDSNPGALLLHCGDG